MAIRAVIFDIGGVLFQQADKSRQRRWEERLGLDENMLGRCIWTMPISHQAEIGQASEDDVWSAVAERFQLNPAQAAALRGDFFSGGQWNDRLIGYAQTLRPRYKTGIISNAWPNARTSVREHISEVGFDDLIFSAEVGLAKPDRCIYALALERLQIQPAEAIFVDDVEGNVEGARAIGMTGLCFENTEHTIELIELYLEASRLAHSRRNGRTSRTEEDKSC